MKDKGRIVWPSDAWSAVQLFIGFQIKIFNEFHILITNKKILNPVVIARKYVNSEITENEYKSNLYAWWDFIDENKAISDFKKKDILEARLAICLLSATKNNVNELDEHLSWFLQVLQCYGLDIVKVKQISNEYFKEYVK